MSRRPMIHSHLPTFIHNTAIAPGIIIDASILNIEGFGNTAGFNEVSSIPAISEDFQSRSLVSLASQSTVDGTSK